MPSPRRSEPPAPRAARRRPGARALRATARVAAAGLAAALLLPASGATAGAGSCAPCLGHRPAEACASVCPPEVRAVREGRLRITRTSDDLSNDCLALDPVHPMLRPESRPRLSKPLDAAERRDAGRHGYRRVRLLPGCAALAGRVPDHVLLGRPLAPEERLRDDGRPKPVVRVDRDDPSCLRGAAFGRSGPGGPPACDVATAVEGTRESGGTIIEIAGGTYPEPDRLLLGHGHVLVARDDAPVTLSGWVDLSSGLGPERPWVRAADDATGTTWVLDWSDHADTGGSQGLRLPFDLDGRPLPMARHFTPATRATDVEEDVFSTYDAGRPGAPPIFLYANPDHPAACIDSGINVKSQEAPCERAGQRVPCRVCEARRVPVRPRKRNGDACEVPPGTCAPVHTWRDVKQAGLAACRAALGPAVRKCVLLKLPRGATPGEHRLRSSHTENGFRVLNDARRHASGIVIRGLRLENLPVVVSGAPRVEAPAGHVARLDALELDESAVELLGSHVILENSHGRQGKLMVSGPRDGLEQVIVRNNVLDRYFGKPVSWGEARKPDGTPPPLRRPERLHALPPLCETGACAGAPRLFSGDEGLAGWRGWNRFTFNLVRHGAGLNAFGPVSYTVVAANVFEHSGIQESIIDLPFDARHVWIHHNWSRDGLGTGIKLVGATEDVVISDNQLLRSPGDLEAGAGTEQSAALCRNPRYRCWGAHRSILLRPGGGACRDVTLENNLSAGSRHGGIAVQACDGLTLRNNTATGAQRLAELLFIGSPRPAGAARLLANIASDPAQPDRPAAEHYEGERFPFRVAEARDGYATGCASDGRGCPAPEGRPLFTTDPAWTGPPVFADPEGDDFHLVGGWRGADRCAEDPRARYPHPGFHYEDERCAP